MTGKLHRYLICHCERSEAISLKITDKFMSKTGFSEPLCHSGLSRILLLSERFPIPKAFGRNDNRGTLVMHSLVAQLNRLLL